ncbi:MAG: agmatine deiminase family protein [Duncaniella sp.]|nr:agmatine deiminase family protein [Duncaniella sp.]
MKMTDRRLPAEWEPQSLVLMAWPHAGTDWAPMLDETLDCFASIIRAVSARTPVLVVGPADLCRDSMAARGFDPERVFFADIPTNDTWARDFGPVTVDHGGIPECLDFCFNGWGMKFAACEDNLVTSRIASLGILPGLRVNRLGFVLEGGSIESDGRGTILTTSECLLSPNRNGQMSRAEIEEYLLGEFGAERMLWLDHGALAGDDTDSHIDTLARLAPHDTIVYVGAGPETNPNHGALAAMLEDLKALRTADGMPYNLVELPSPDPVRDPDDGSLLPATYANFLISNGAVFLPVYGQPMNDRLAEMTLQAVFPDCEIVPMDCRALIRQHGSLHCVTMQIPQLSNH